MRCQETFLLISVSLFKLGEIMVANKTEKKAHEKTKNSMENL